MMITAGLCINPHDFGIYHPNLKLFYDLRGFESTGLQAFGR